jgi:hypothetical protein
MLQSEVFSSAVDNASVDTHALENTSFLESRPLYAGRKNDQQHKQRADSPAPFASNVPFEHTRRILRGKVLNLIR